MRTSVATLLIAAAAPPVFSESRSSAKLRVVRRDCSTWLRSPENSFAAFVVLAVTESTAFRADDAAPSSPWKFAPSPLASVDVDRSCFERPARLGARLLLSESPSPLVS